MRKRFPLWTLVLPVLFCAGLVRAEDKPNFSGTWKQNNEKSKLNRPSTLKSYVNKIEHKDPNLKVVTTLVGDRGEYTYERSYTTGGKEQVTKDREGDEFHTTVKWEGKTLVFETSEVERERKLTTTEKWTLSEDGKTLTKVRRTSGPRGDLENTYVLEKQ